MSNFFTFIIEKPFLFIILVLIIYMIITYYIQKKKIEEIERIFKTINNYLEEKFTIIEKLLEILKSKHQLDDEVLNELKIIESNVILFKSKNLNDKVKASNGINNFVLNSAILRNKKYEDLHILVNIELFTQQQKDINIYRQKYNDLVTDFNHDNLNPPNSYVAKLFGMDKHYSIIENNFGKKPKEAEKKQ